MSSVSRIILAKTWGRNTVRRFVFVGVDSSRKSNQASKFWEIGRKGSALTIRFGPIGANGQTTLKEFATPDEAKKAEEKSIAEKLKKGYVEESASQKKPAAPRASAKTNAKPVSETRDDAAAVAVGTPKTGKIGSSGAPEVQVNFCSNCGAKNNGGLFCSNCGTAFIARVTETAGDMNAPDKKVGKPVEVTTFDVVLEVSSSWSDSAVEHDSLHDFKHYLWGNNNSTNWYQRVGFDVVVREPDENDEADALLISGALPQFPELEASEVLDNETGFVDYGLVVLEEDEEKGEVVWGYWAQIRTTVISSSPELAAVVCREFGPAIFKFDDHGESGQFEVDEVRVVSINGIPIDAPILSKSIEVCDCMD
jgi:predicted DNA-binding WGR domain protein